jgi:2-polyprenyl-3-methyl-5-hydroxy-6-metoxy-1,4-benzoquinol methylase
VTERTPPSATVGDTARTADGLEREVRILSDMDDALSRQAAIRNRLYESYATTHAGVGTGDAARLVFRRDIQPYLPPQPSARIVDIGCGQGELVRLLIEAGYQHAEGVDVSPEQVRLAHAAGLTQVHEGDLTTFLEASSGQLDAVLATDLLEHLTKDEVLATLDRALAALRPGGVLIARVPNASSPFSGGIRHGDFTHETWYTARSVQQIAAAVGFERVVVLPCGPLAHGVKSACRVGIWKVFSGFFKLGLAAETGALRGNIVTQNLTFVASKGSAAT